MTFRIGNFKVKITVKKDGALVIEIEPWERKGGLTPPAPILLITMSVHKVTFGVKRIA